MGVSWGGVSLYFSRRPDWYLTLSPLVVFYLKFGDIGDHARAPYDIFILFHCANIAWKFPYKSRQMLRFSEVVFSLHFVTKI